ncbi:MATE family efflux transporter [Flavobacteriaceae bacterium]|nr:MATE family efflux transporter [Flavobacteriaceae bacterium]
MTYRFRDINKLAIPAIISGIVEPLLSLTDTAIVGNVPVNAVEALAAVGIAGSFLSAIVWILAQTRSAISALIASHLGANKLDEVASLPSQILLINVLLSVLLMGLTSYFAYGIFEFYNAQGLILDTAVSYYKIRAYGLPLILIIFTLFGVFRGMQNTFWPMIIAVIGAVVNIGLDLVLVYGIENWIPPMGVEGAAWASIIAQVVMALLSVYLVLKKTPFRWDLGKRANPSLKPLINLSLNLFVRSASLNVALYFSNAFATAYGGASIAAQTIAFQIWLFFSFFIDGYSSVANIVSGKLKGANDFKSLKNLINSVMKIAVIIAVGLGALCFVIYKPIGLLFTKDAAVLLAFYQIFWMVLIMQPINAVAFVYDGVFKGMAEAVALRNTLLIATFLGFVPTIYLTDYFGLKLYGIWIAFMVWMLLRAGILIRIFNQRILPKKA